MTVGAVTGIALFALGARHELPLVTWSICAFVLTVIATEFWKGTRARARIEGEGYELITVFRAAELLELARASSKDG